MRFSVYFDKTDIINIYQHIYHNKSYKQVIIYLFITYLSTDGDNSVDNCAPLISHPGNTNKRQSIGPL